MQLINKIDMLIELANYRIAYLLLDLNNDHIKKFDSWDRGYHRGYITAMNKYVDDLKNLKKIIIEINKDDDDV
jgi:hypothetical protein